RVAPRMAGDGARGVRARHHHRAQRLARELDIDGVDGEQRRERDLVAARAQARGGTLAVILRPCHQQAHAVTQSPAIADSSLPGLTPQVGYTRLAAIKTAELGQARVPMQSIHFRKKFLAKKMDARVVSAFTRVFRRAMPAHDGVARFESEPIASHRREEVGAGALLEFAPGLGAETNRI